MKSNVLARKVAAFSASSAVLAAMVSGLMATPASAATSVSAGKAVTATAAKTSSRAKVSVSAPKASTGDYQGSCPVKVDFSSKIKVSVKGKTELAYRWLHGDGSKGKVKVVKLKGNGTKTVNVKQSITFKGNVKGWEAVQVLGPRKVTSKRGYFSVTCGDDNVPTDKDPQVSARAWANPDSYAGPCTPGDKIDFTGLIKVNQPSWVRYRWVLNGDVVDYGKVKVWEARKVGFGFSPRSSHRGWAVLEILGPDRTESNRAYYKVWCKDEAPAAKVSATDLVTGTNHDGCKVGANANINATGRAKVEYVWSVNGNTVLKGETYFDGSGSKNVVLPDQVLAGSAKNGGKVTLSVYGPNNNDSITQSYVACKAEEPPATTVKVALDAVVDQSTCKDGKGATVNVTATVTVNGAAKNVSVLLSSEAGGLSKSASLNFDKAGSQTVTWQLTATGTNGATAKATLPGGASDSNLRTWGDHCPKVDA